MTSKVYSLVANFTLFKKEVFEIVGAAISENNFADKALFVISDCRERIKLATLTEKVFTDDLEAGSNFLPFIVLGKYSKL